MRIFKTNSKVVNGLIARPKLRNISLLFLDKKMEADFRTRYFHDSIGTYRISILTVIVLYAAFALLDFHTSQEFYQEFYFVRFAIVIPSLALVFASSFLKFFIKHWQMISAFELILAGTGIVFMLIRHPLNLYYYGGMFLIFMGGYFFIKLRFIYALLSGIILIVFYNIGMLYKSLFFETVNIYWIAANAFFISANIICIIGLYSIEKLERTSFFQQCLLNNQKEEIAEINEGLEIQVQERTQLLHEKNNKLNEEIEHRRAVEYEHLISKEKAEESDRLKTAFLANMSHEIRTPMNGILGFANLLNEPDLSDDEKNNFLKIIQKSGNRMLATVNDIIEISKIETGQLTANYTAVSINALIDEVYQFFKLEVQNKGMELIKSLDLSDEQSYLFSDSKFLESVLTNLVKNAIKYSSKGTIEMGYRKSGDHILFFVKDEGIGISKEKTNRIFDRFHQLNSDKTKAVEGSGLGLSISKAYIELLEGEIWVESEENKGSIFYFKLKHLIPHIEKSNPPIIEYNFKESTNYDHKSILIVEDEEDIFAYLKHILTPTNIRILWAKNGKEAILFNKKYLPDIILMDINMPIMDGYTATKQIKKDFAKVPIIAQTAFAISGDKEKTLAAGCNDYLSKPIEKTILLQTIKKYLN